MERKYDSDSKGMDDDEEWVAHGGESDSELEVEGFEG